MLRVMIECKNVRSEKIARHLTKLTDVFKIWVHGNSVYALFDIGSLPKLNELGKRLRRVKNTELRFMKIGTLTNYEKRKSNKHFKGRNRQGNPRKDA